jgi:selenophosphate synthase
MDWGDTGTEWRSLLTDPQTSGGLLLSVESAREAALLDALEAVGEEGHVIGQVSEGSVGVVRVL